MQTTLQVKFRGGLKQDVSVPQSFMFYSFGTPRYIKICATCAEGVAVTITTYGKTIKKFLAHSTVFNYYRFAPSQLSAADYWSGEPYLEQ